MTSILEYTADSSPFLREWRKRGAAPSPFLAEVRKHRRYQGISWRGTSLRTVGEFSPVISSSKEIQVAYDFSCYHIKPAIIAFIGYEGYNISSSSCHQEEDEILLIINCEISTKYITLLEKTPVYLACKASNYHQWEQEVKYQINRFQTFLEDYDL